MKNNLIFPKDSRLCVRACVRLSITRLLENRSLLFSETLQLVRACKRFFEKIPVLPILAKNCPKLAILAQNAQKWRFSHFVFQSVHQNLLIFCTKSSLWSREKITFWYFLGKFKNCRFWPNFGHFLLKISVISCLWFSIKLI